MPDSAASAGAATDPGIARVNALSPEEFRTELAQCLNIDRWVETLLSERPFGPRPALLNSADAHARTITDDEVDSALARHPRIGERASGDSTEAKWSRGEQSGFSSGASDLQEEFRSAQAAYEHHFGQIYLVCASGRSTEELLADLRERMANDRATESRVVAEELRKIALLRLEKVLDDA